VNDPDPVRALHWSTMHGERPAHPERLVRFRPLDPGNRPAPFKSYPGLAPSLLPRELVRSDLPATEVLSGRRAGPQPLTEDRLSTLLFLTGGVTRFAVGDDGEPVYFRTAMSAGNLHPVEVYVVTRDSVSHYQPLPHALVALRGAPAGSVAAGGATLVLTGVPFRTCWKYGERGWRHLWWDAGTMLANLLVAADALGVDAMVTTGFSDTEVAELVGVDGLDEAPLALAALGPAAAARLPEPSRLGPLRGLGEPPAARTLRFPLANDAHQAGSLDARSVAPWLDAVRSLSAAAPEAVEAPAPAPRPADRVEDVILRRGSTRLFKRSTVEAAALSWGLAAASRAVPTDAGRGATLLEHLVSVHGVEGIAPGPYRYSPGRGYEPGGTGSSGTGPAEHRHLATRLCLGQPLGGDSAFTSFAAADLERLLEGAGARAYRTAHLEAGIVAGRLSLNAAALGLGATGLTFYDGAVARHFGAAALPLLATAVGPPETKPAPSGKPGRPAALRGYGRVAASLWARLERPER
jgi:SagB-type dehydrogenase family enzyme